MEENRARNNMGANDWIEKFIWIKWKRHLDKIRADRVVFD